MNPLWCMVAFSINVLTFSFPRIGCIGILWYEPPSVKYSDNSLESGRLHAEIKLLMVSVFFTHTSFLIGDGYLTLAVAARRQKRPLAALVI
jgi:hypothetical protein